MFLTNKKKYEGIITVSCKMYIHFLTNIDSIKFLLQEEKLVSQGLVTQKLVFTPDITK